jgi:hypothetical protein
MNISKIERLLHYYEMEILCKDETEKIGMDQIFKQIRSKVSPTNNSRYQVFGERIVIIQDLIINETEQYIQGKLKCVRKDLFPEIMDTNTDVSKGIEAKDQEGVVETSHFSINYRKKNPILCLEYNQFGSKIGDFMLMLTSNLRN